jgi:hypothetical protein
VAGRRADSRGSVGELPPIGLGARVTCSNQRVARDMSTWVFPNRVIRGKPSRCNRFVMRLLSHISPMAHGRLA